MSIGHSSWLKKEALRFVPFPSPSPQHKLKAFIRNLLPITKQVIFQIMKKHLKKFHQSVNVHWNGLKHLTWLFTSNIDLFLIKHQSISEICITKRAREYSQLMTRNRALKDQEKLCVWMRLWNYHVWSRGVQFPQQWSKRHFIIKKARQEQDQENSSQGWQEIFKLTLDKQK